MSFCGLIKGITPKIRMLRFVLINNVLLDLLCVWILLINQSIDIYSHEYVIHIKNVYVRACVHLCVCGGGGRGSCMLAICVVCVCPVKGDGVLRMGGAGGERIFSYVSLCH